MRSSTIARYLAAAVVSTAFLWTIALSTSPRLHEQVHPNATHGQHECAVTLMASGNCHYSTGAALVTGLIPAVQFSKIPALNPVWVASPFLAASIFEHAPPAK